jgi:quercetin dioxygenase-like cupin family protein
METFYERWLERGSEIQREFKRAPGIAKDGRIPWVRTPQDARVKLMVAKELGFATMGNCVLKAEIPVGWHTGKHTHGEESIHILKGHGFIVIHGERFDFRPGTTIQIPYRAEHQLFNTGDDVVQYVSGMSFDLESYVMLARIEQLDECGPNDPARLSAFPAQMSEYYRGGPRAIIHLEDAPTELPTDENSKLPANVNQHFLTRFLVREANGFRFTTVAATHMFEEPPGTHGGRHKHLEAMIYVVQGEGYSELEGQEEKWETGDVLHVPPAMWEHEHYNDSTVTYKLLRIETGIRFWFTRAWPEGYTSTRIYDAEGRPIEAGYIERVRERG